MQSLFTAAINTQLSTWTLLRPLFPAMGKRISLKSKEQARNGSPSPSTSALSIILDSEIANEWSLMQAKHSVFSNQHVKIGFSLRLFIWALTIPVPAKARQHNITHFTLLAVPSSCRECCQIRNHQFQGQPECFFNPCFFNPTLSIWERKKPQLTLAQMLCTL